MEEILPLIDFTKLKKKKKEIQASNSMTKNTDDLEEVVLSKKKGKKEKNSTKRVEKENNNIESDFVINCGYTYDDLLNRIYRIIKEKNPENQGEKSGFKIPPPIVNPAGKSRVCWINFGEYPKALNRNVDHLFQYILNELGVEGTIGGDNQVNLKSRTTGKEIEKILVRYCNDYVKCPNCKSFKTSIQKDQSTRLMQIHCDICKSQKTIQNLKSKVKTGKNK